MVIYWEYFGLVMPTWSDIDPIKHSVNWADGRMNLNRLHRICCERNGTRVCVSSRNVAAVSVYFKEIRTCSASESNISADTFTHHTYYSPRLCTPPQAIRLSLVVRET